MDIFQLAKRLDNLQDRFREKMPEGASGIDFEAVANWAFGTVYLRFGYFTAPEGFPSNESFFEEEELEKYLIELEHFIDAMPSRELTAQRLAAKDLGRAIDNARATGLDVDSIAVSFAGIWENLLEDHS